MKKAYLSFDIGGTFLKYGLISGDGYLLEESKVMTSPTWEGLVESLRAVIENGDYEILGVGISCPGTVDVETGIVYEGGMLPYLDKVSIKQFIEEEFGYECFVTNDGKAAISAEKWQGNLIDISNASVIVLGSGVAGALLINGNLVEGAHFKAGEYSFVSDFNSEGLSEYDLIGMKGSAVMFIRKCAEVLALDDLHDGEKVFEVIKSGDNAEINKLFDAYCQSIAHLIMNTQAILDLEKVVIGGGISKQGYLIDNIDKQYKLMKRQIPLYQEKFKDLEISACKFGNSANLIGAVYPFFKSKILVA